MSGTEQREILWLAPTAPPRRDPYKDPDAYVRRLVALLDELGLTGELRRSRELLARSETLGEAARQGRRAAELTWQAEQRRLTGTGPLEVERLTGVLDSVRPWLDTELEGPTPHAAPAMAALMEASQACRGGALQMVNAESTGIHGRLQAVAAEVVARVATLPDLPGQIWSAAPATAAHVAITSGHERTWAALVHDGERFHQCHLAAELLRDTGGLGVWNAGACPEGIGIVWRQWERAQAGYEPFKRLAGPLRLPYAVREGWEPGLWRQEDITGRPATPAPKRGLLGALVGHRG